MVGREASFVRKTSGRVPPRTCCGPILSAAGRTLRERRPFEGVGFISIPGLPLQLGDRGVTTRDLRRRLSHAGFEADGDEHEVFGPATENALRAFQDSRGLDVDGVCGPQTWNALIESSHKLGDRHLYLTRPMLRGDDVSALQQRLGQLGFDAGRVDGIFGPDTQSALAEFQRNSGLTADAVCGTATVEALERFSTRTGPQSVAQVRESERLRAAPRRLDGRRVVVGEFGGLSALCAAVAAALRTGGARVITLHDDDRSAQAAASNEFAADAYLGFVVSAEPICTLSYFATEGYESPGGRRLAELLAVSLPGALGEKVPTSCTGMRLPVLRETKMPAVVCRLGPATAVVQTGRSIADAVTQSLAAWARDPVE